MLKKFQSTPRPLIKIRSQINQTLLENLKTRSVSDSFNRNGEKPVRASDVNPLRHLALTAHPAAQPDQPDPAQKFSIGYAIAIENHFRINRTLHEKFQSDFDFIFSTRLCLQFSNRILIKKICSVENLNPNKLYKPVKVSENNLTRDFLFLDLEYPGFQVSPE
ncbi:MAG: hypothetical protein ACYDDV_03080, partial [Methanoregula sp.]